MLWTLILLQVDGTAALPNYADFDLSKIEPKRSEECQLGAIGEIVVCGKARTTGIRLERIEGTAEPILPRAEIGLIGKSRLSVDAQAVSVGGFISNRMMAGVKIPF